MDVGNLYDCLYGMHKGLVDESILDRYSEVRRNVYLNFVDPVSSSNLRRLCQEPDVAMKEDPFFKMAVEFGDNAEAWRDLVTVRATLDPRKLELIAYNRLPPHLCTILLKSTGSKSK